MVRLAWALPSMEIASRLGRCLFIEEILVLRMAHHQWGGLSELGL
jgi:hypothetical protein